MSQSKSPNKVVQWSLLRSPTDHGVKDLIFFIRRSALLRQYYDSLMRRKN